jgi:hypothetical protein
MAPDSKIDSGRPSGPSGSTMAGMRPLGLMAWKAGANCSPVPMFTGFIL